MALLDAFFRCVSLISTATSEADFLVLEGFTKRSRTYMGSTESLDTVYTPAFPVDSRYEHYFKPTMLTDFNYLKTGIDMLDEDSWERTYDLTLSLYVEAAEMAYLNSDSRYMNRLVNKVLDRATNLLDKVKVYKIRILSLVAGNRPSEAVRQMLRSLMELGVLLPEKPGKVSIVFRLLRLKMLVEREKMNISFRCRY